MKKHFTKHFSLTLILLISFWVNVTGLLPNTYLHQNEPGVMAPGDTIFKNFLEKGSLDPNVKPEPFKYASAIFYMHGLIRGGVLFFYYSTYKLSGFTFDKDPVYFENISFYEFVENQGPTLFGNSLLWFSRFSTVLFGAGTVLLTYLTTLKLFKKKTLAHLSALSLAVMPFFTRNAHYATVDILQSFFFLFSFFVSLRILDRSSYKNYAAAAFLVGFSSSLKYFPLPLVPYLIIHLLVVKKRIISKPFLLSLPFIFLGYLTGMPFLFVHFWTIANFIPYALTWYGPDQLEINRPLWARFLPSYFHAFHFKFLIDRAIYLPPLILSLVGVLIGLKNYRRESLLLLIIPLVNGVFITFYVKQIYEQLTMPMLPFLAIFIALALNWLVKRLSGISFFPFRLILIFGVLFFVLLHPFLNSVQASLDCTKEITDFQTRDWIKKNIPENKKFAYHPGTRHPDLKMDWIQSEVKTDFSYSELQSKGANFILLIDGYYNTYLEWTTDSFFPPEEIVENQYVQLALSELKANGQLIAKFSKHPMCVSNTLEIYQLPPVLSNASNLMKEYNLNDPAQLEQFQLLNPNEEVQITYDEKSGINASGALKLEFNQILFQNHRRDFYLYYSTPLFSDSIEIKQNTKYTISALVKPDISDAKVLRDGYLRMDFYDKSGKILKTNLSPKADTAKSWQTLEVTAISPNDSRFMTVGFQSLVLGKKELFLLDNFKIYEN